MRLGLASDSGEENGRRRNFCWGYWSLFCRLDYFEGLLGSDIGDRFCPVPRRKQVTNTGRIQAGDSTRLDSLVLGKSNCVGFRNLDGIKLPQILQEGRYTKMWWKKTMPPPSQS